MGRVKDIAIDLDSLTEQDWIDARAIMLAGGVDPDALALAVVQADPAAAPVPALAALIYVSRRRARLRTTPEQATRWALAVSGGE